MLILQAWIIWLFLLSKSLPPFHPSLSLLSFSPSIFFSCFNHSTQSEHYTQRNKTSGALAPSFPLTFYFLTRGSLLQQNYCVSLRCWPVHCPLTKTMPWTKFWEQVVQCQQFITELLLYTCHCFKCWQKPDMGPINSVLMRWERLWSSRDIWSMLWGMTRSLLAS